MLPNANIRNDVLVFYSFKQNIIKTILEKIIRDVAKYQLQISWELEHKYVFLVFKKKLKH
jgi:hypothetical protein